MAENLPAKVSVQAFLNEDKVKTYLEGVLKDRSGQFIANLVSLANLDGNIAKCEPKSLMMCGLKATALNLPLDNNLGFAYAIPYNNSKKGVTEAQFQLGFRSFLQLAMRTGLYRSINVIDIREGELTAWDALTETFELKVIDNEKRRESTPIAGYAASFELKNGFRKTIYKKKEALLAHGKRFSKAFSSGPWKSDTDAMCRKTLLKELLSKWAPLSIEVMEGIKYDQAIIKETGEPEYIDIQDEVQPEAIDYNLPPELLDDINHLCDILKVADAEKAMKLGSFKGDVKKAEEWKKEMEIEVGNLMSKE